MNLGDTDYLREYYRKQAMVWREKREQARLAGDFAAFDYARRECNQYARGLPADEQAAFWED